MAFRREEISIYGLARKANPADLKLAQYILAAEANKANVFPPLSNDQLKRLPAEQQLIADGRLSHNGHLEVNPELLEAIGPSLAADFCALCQEHNIPVLRTRDGVSMQFAQLLTILAR